ncbi:hypothetical protein [Actinomadura decatromicini]|nr:hypothetical protein [Actinomadura decatromicini]
MDPFFALIIALYIAGKFTKNVAQDVAWKARGEDPPSYRREQERWKRKQAKRAKGDGPGRRLLLNAWADACAAGDERRARLAQRAAERRRAQWAEADADAVEAEAREINDRVASPATEPVFTCGGCQREIGQSEVAGYALSGDPLCRTCRTAPAEPTADKAADDAETSKDTRRRCHACGFLKDPADLRNAACFSCPGDEGANVNACTDCLQATRDQQETADRAFESDTHVVRARASTQPAPETEVPSAPDHPDGATGTVTSLAEWRSKGATPPLTREDIVSESGETTNLAAALQYAQSMAQQCAAGAVSCETSRATLTGGGVSGEAITRLHHAEESLQRAQADFLGMHSALMRQVNVKDAYQAAPEAGDKSFQMQE